MGAFPAASSGPYIAEAALAVVVVIEEARFAVLRLPAAPSSR
ncbi:MAG: hypothetical protein R2932_03945 [Caldilineaceae bacterium]